jgi:hypothetical protein
MKKFLIIYAVLFVVSGCATVKTPQVSGTSKEDRFVDLSFEYGLLERPKVNWEQAESTTVTQKCLSWGYQKPSASSEVNDECLETNRNGKCIKHAVSKRYQCGLTPEQIAVQKEIERKKQTLLTYLFNHAWSESERTCSLTETRFSQNKGTYHFIKTGNKSFSPDSEPKLPPEYSVSDNLLTISLKETRGNFRQFNSYTTLKFISTNKILYEVYHELDGKHESSSLTLCD